MKILIRGTNWIGDAVMTIPAIRYLKRLFPEASFTLLAPAATFGIFDSSDLFDEMIPTGRATEQVREIRRRRFDTAIVFTNSFKSALIPRLAGIKRRAGYASEKRTFLLTDALEVPRWKDERHEVYYYLHLARSFGLTAGREADEVPEITVNVGQAESERARQFLTSEGISMERLKVGLAPGSTNSRAKRWTPEGFARVNDLLQDELGANVLLLGSPDDMEVSGRVLALCSKKPIDLTGKTEISVAAAVLGELDLLISNDMGLAHLAPAVGTKTIVIFGPTNQLTTRPYSEIATVISANVECSPCMLRDCPIDHRCMTRISADSVFETAKRILGGD